MTALREHLDGRWADVRQMAREMLADPRLVPSLGSLDDQRARTFDRLRMLAEAGVSRLGFPKQYGGLDDLGGSITGFEMLALGDLSLLVKAGVQFGLFGGAILHLGTERHHERYLADVMSVALPGCFAMTETGHGSDVASLRTTATYDDGEFVIQTPDDDARKDYIGNAARDGHAAVVFAQLITAGRGQGVHAFVVPIRDDDGAPAPGVRVEDCGPKAGLNGVDNGRLWFDGVRIPRENLLNRYGDVAPDGTYSTPIGNPARRFFTMLGTLIQGRVSVAGGAGSATKVALAIAVRYAEVRRQFAAPGRDGEIVLLDYLAHQRRLLPALARTYALHFAQGELVGALHDDFADEERRRPLETRAAAIKAAATWHATATIQACREACGGAGYLSENQFPRLKADTDVFTTFEGDNTVLLQLVGKELLTAYRSHFGELDLLGTIRFVTEQAAEIVVEHTAAHRIIQRLLDAAPGPDADLRDRAWHVQLFEWREKHLLDTVARRLRRAADSDDPFAIFNTTQDHLLRASRAHADRLLLEAFVAGIDSAPASVQELLDAVCDLFVLSTVEDDRAWFIEHGRLSTQRSKAVIAMVDSLCAELRPHASTLIDGFGVPDACITAPIAQP
ncbi:MAG TPA: acyl-CoA dehydrogenase [Jatrophihabitantaceae bacterium]